MLGTWTMTTFSVNAYEIYPGPLLPFQTPGSGEFFRSSHMIPCLLCVCSPIDHADIGFSVRPCLQITKLPSTVSENKFCNVHNLS